MLFKVEYDELVDQLEKMNKTSLVTLGDFIIKMVNCEIGKEDMYSRIGITLTKNLETFKIEPRIKRISSSSSSSGGLFRRDTVKPSHFISGHSGDLINF